MQVSGSITDSETGQPIKGARVGLRLGARHFTSSTDGSGRYDWRVDGLYLGESLTLRVEKEGFGPGQVIQSIDRDVIRVDLTLVPLEKPAVHVLFRLHDRVGSPIPGAELVLRSDQEVVGSWRSTADGTLLAVVPAEFGAREVTYTIAAPGFRPTEAAFRPSEVPAGSLQVQLDRLEALPLWRRVLGDLRWRLGLPYALLLFLAWSWLPQRVVLAQAMVIGFLFYALLRRLESGRVENVVALLLVSLLVSARWPAVPLGVLLAGVALVLAERAGRWLSRSGVVSLLPERGPGWLLRIRQRLEKG